jgi:di/tricarboxylate transporter
MAITYMNAVHVVAKLLAESDYHYQMSGGMGWQEYAEPAEILAKIYSIPIKKVRRMINNRKEIHSKKLWARKRR